jgi:hypothetical protein
MKHAVFVDLFIAQPQLLQGEALERLAKQAAAIDAEEERPSYGSPISDGGYATAPTMGGLWIGP